MKLEAIESKTHVIGVEADVVVRILDVEPAGPDAVNVSYKLPNGYATTLKFKNAEFEAE